MKRFLWATPMLFLLMSGSAFASSVSTFIFLQPNDGSGDNFGFFQQGGGVTIGIGGGTPYDFFNIDGYAPGSTLGGSTDVFIDGGFVKFGGNFHELDFSGPGTLFLSSFTLPTNGKDFTINSGAFFAFSAILDNGQTFDVFGHAPGKMRFTFGEGIYTTQPVRLSTVPEPSTLGFLATGVIGIFALARCKGHSRRPCARN